MSKIKGKPDVDAFLNGADATAIHKKTATTANKKAIPKRGKMVQLPTDLLNDLKQTAFKKGIAAGHHVTETAVIEAALRAYIYR